MKDHEKKRMNDAVKKAVFCFWQSIANSYPEAVTGDVDPFLSCKFDAAADEAVASWVNFNIKPPTEKELLRQALSAIENSYDIIDHPGYCPRSMGSNSMSSAIDDIRNHLDLAPYIERDRSDGH